MPIQLQSEHSNLEAAGAQGRDGGSRLIRENRHLALRERQSRVADLALRRWEARHRRSRSLAVTRSVEVGASMPEFALLGRKLDEAVLPPSTDKVADNAR